MSLEDKAPPKADLPDAHEMLSQTNWATLNHAYGRATDAPITLVALLDADPSVRTKALNKLHDVLHHQNTIYEATVPAAQYVASILPDSRTLLPVDKARHAFPGCLRAELLLWIASVAVEVTDAMDAVRQLHGFPLEDYPPAVAIREMRPILFRAACTYVDDPDRHVCEAAITACIPLLDDARLLEHRPALVPLIRQVLGTSDLWQHRERAIDALDSWGEDFAGIQGQRNPFLFCDTDLSPDNPPWRSEPAEGWSDPPPF
ncbi:hypothetical protein ABT300_02550 [Streptomyces sp. NPDC001027]|uniref:hypothetical protein n=1 Tax=Streptomyces sp. NPDC001027 TaxID=3154771 RepID=UPI00331BE7AA